MSYYFCLFPLISAYFRSFLLISAGQDGPGGAVRAQEQPRRVQEKKAQESPGDKASQGKSGQGRARRSPGGAQEEQEDQADQEGQEGHEGP